MKDKMTVKRRENSSGKNEMTISTSLSSNLSAHPYHLLCYLLGNCKNWIVYTSYTMKILGIGKVQFQQSMRTLISKGYVKRTQIRENGKFSHLNYEVDDKPSFLCDDDDPCEILKHDDVVNSNEDVKNSFDKKIKNKLDRDEARDTSRLTGDGENDYGKTGHKISNKNRPNDACDRGENAEKSRLNGDGENACGTVASENACGLIYSTSYDKALLNSTCFPESQENPASSQKITKTTKKQNGNEKAVPSSTSSPCKQRSNSQRPSKSDSKPMERKTQQKMSIVSSKQSYSIVAPLKSKRTIRRSEEHQQAFEWLMSTDLCDQKEPIREDTASYLSYTYTLQELQDAWQHLSYKKDHSGYKPNSTIAFYRHILKNEHCKLNVNSSANRGKAERIKEKFKWDTLEIHEKYVYDSKFPGKDVSLTVSEQDFCRSLENLYHSLR